MSKLEPGGEARKKPYNKPELVAYGDIRVITQGMTGSFVDSDGVPIFPGSPVDRKTGVST